MPNETCFLIAYILAFIGEFTRLRGSGDWVRRWSPWVTTGLMLLAIITHSLYLLDRFWNTWSGNQLAAFRSWQDWGYLASWLVAIASLWLSYRRSDKQIGLFVLPIVIAIVGLAVAFPSDSPIAVARSAASYWRMVHSTAMLVGTMLVALGFAVAMMYLVQGWRLKHRSATTNSLRLPSLEYLQSLGRKCILGSAVAVGFGVVSGVIMTLARDGQIAWNDRGILFSAALFAWLSAAAVLQWFSSSRGRGEWTAMLSVLSFVIVIAALAVVISTPHGVSPAAFMIPPALRELA
jgi:ABC-type uncharacterized transport system permease subunit